MRIAALAFLLALLPGAAAAQSGVSEGGISSENVEFLDHIETTEGVAEGGRLWGTTFFLTNNNQGLLAFDVSDPENPREVGRLVLPHGAENEDVATNGRILLLSQLGDAYHLTDGAAQASTILNVVDVREPSNMKVIATVPGGGDHTWDCVLDCKWAYSASGLILDLRDPSKPVLLTERWRDQYGADGGIAFSHDVSEVAPGLVMTASVPMALLDARRDPVRPQVLAVAPEDEYQPSNHNVVWPRQATDRFIVTASEGQDVGRCEVYDDSASLMVWDSTGWEQTKTFKPLGRYKPVNGTGVDGQPPVSATWYGCSAHWAETHPTFHDGGLLAGAFYSHGARLLNVDASGALSEVGWFVAHGAGASAVYWITDRVLYVADDTRGLDVIKYTGPLPERPAPPPALPPGKAAPLVDNAAPRVRLRAVRLDRRGVLRVTVACSETCSGELVARAGRRTARRRIAVTAGRPQRVSLRLGRGVRRLRLSAAVVDAAGNRRVARRTVRAR